MTIQWTNRKEELFQKLWHDGVMIKVIAHKMGCSVWALKSRRRRLKLPRRHTKEDGGTYLKFRIDAELYAKIMKKASNNQSTLSEYIRVLIKRNVDNAINQN